MSQLNSKPDSNGPVSCSFQDSSLLRMDSVHGNIVISKSLSEHTLGVSPSKPIVVGSLSHSESSPFKEVIPHNLLQKQLSKDSVNSIGVITDSKEKRDFENEVETSVVDLSADYKPESNHQLDLSTNENFEDADMVDNEPNNLNESLSTRESLLESSPINEPSCLINNNKGIKDHKSCTESTITHENDLNNDYLSNQRITENTLENNTDSISDNDYISNKDNVNTDTSNNQEEIDNEDTTLSNNSRSQSEVSVVMSREKEKDTNYDVLPSPDDRNQMKEGNNIDGTENTPGIGGSQQMVDVLKLGTSVNSANDFFIPGIHASPPLEPEPGKLTDAEVDFMAQDSNTRLKIENSLPREDRLSGVLGTSFESSGNFSDSGSDCHSGSDCFSEQSFSLLADLGITDDFIGIKEDHFSTEVGLSFFQTFRFLNSLSLFYCILKMMNISFKQHKNIKKY